MILTNNIWTLVRLYRENFIAMHRNLKAGRGTAAAEYAVLAHHYGRKILKKGGTMADLKDARG